MQRDAEDVVPYKHKLAVRLQGAFANDPQDYDYSKIEHIPR